MSEKYDAVVADYESPSDFEQGDFQAFAFSEAMLAAIEIRQLLTIDPLPAFNLSAGRNPKRVLELVHSYRNAAAMGSTLL